jgi:hypothetical protein
MSGITIISVDGEDGESGAHEDVFDDPAFEVRLSGS